MGQEDVLDVLRKDRGWMTVLEVSEELEGVCNIVSVKKSLVQLVRWRKVSKGYFGNRLSYKIKEGE